MRLNEKQTHVIVDLDDGLEGVLDPFIEVGANPWRVLDKLTMAQADIIYDDNVPADTAEATARHYEVKGAEFGTLLVNKMPEEWTANLLSELFDRDDTLNTRAA